MRTLRLRLVVIVTVALLVGLSGAVAGQVEDGRSADWLTFTKQDCTVGDHDPATSENGVEQLRDMPITCDVTFSDPRVSGAHTILFSQDCFDAGICVYWGPQDIVGPDGTWSGWSNGTTDSDGNANGYVVLTGAGGYDGLTFVSHAMGPFNEPPTAVGVIYEGDPPPLP